MAAQACMSCLEWLVRYLPCNTAINPQVCQPRPQVCLFVAIHGVCLKHSIVLVRTRHRCSMLAGRPSVPRPPSTGHPPASRFSQRRAHAFHTSPCIHRHAVRRRRPQPPPPRSATHAPACSAPLHPLTSAWMLCWQATSLTNQTDAHNSCSSLAPR